MDLEARISIAATMIRETADCTRFHDASDKLFHLRSREEAIPVMPLKEKKEDIGRTILFRNQAMFRNQRGSVKNGKKMAL
ncbi:hypothetical protein TNCV_4719571 [Trichonephila clavipes]|uniref:Uncharacterized protein n=1 Tax=Trichonephila clavipes TaxID=2585209 RepID=A0A8X6W5S6_TRICX|nr:hypothetical protein TNCV_4719571 [Trichonephila clavipes]